MATTSSRRIPPLSERDIARFWAKVRKTDNCWLWQGWTRTDTGYGFFAIMFDTPHGRAAGNFAAHRVAYVIANGPIPEGLDVLHSCDRPGCVKLTHLSAGTDADNAADKMLRGRHPRGGRVPGVALPREALPARSGERHWFAKMSDANVRELRKRYAREAIHAADVARDFGVSVGYAGMLITGRSRRQAGGPISALRPVVGRSVKGAKLTEQLVADLRRRFAAGQTIYELAPVFGIAPQTVSNIIRRQTWKHVPVEAPVRAGHRKMTRQQVTKIRQRHAAGASQRRMAKDYRVSPATISLIVNRRTHAH